MVFDQVKHYKDTLKYLVTACNQTEALGALIPNLEEFIDVAQSECFCFIQEIILDLINTCVKINVKFYSFDFRVLAGYHHLCKPQLCSLHLACVGMLQVKYMRL